MKYNVEEKFNDNIDDFKLKKIINKKIANIIELEDIYIN